MIKVPKNQNSHADSLATLASSLDNCIPRMITIEMLEQLSTESPLMVAASSELESSWMDPYIAFLLDETLPDNVKEAKKVRRMTVRFWLSNNERLFWRSFGGLYLLCLHPSKSIELLVELHKGLCGSHSGGQSLAHRAMTLGFWWPSMQREIIEYVKRCDRC